MEAKTWLSGSTQIDLRRTADRAGGLVNWKTEWRLELDPRNPRPLEIELDPGLELIDVQGAGGSRLSQRAVGNRDVRSIVTLDGGLEDVDRAAVPGPRPGPVGGRMDDSGAAAAQRDLDRGNDDGVPR